MNILLPILVVVLAQDPAAPSSQNPAPVLEAPTPGNPHSTATDVLHAASEGTRDHAHAAVVAPLEAGQAALVEARQGNGTVLILGTRDGLEMVQGLGGQAAVRALDSVRTLPAQVDAASQDGTDSWAQWEVAQDGRNQRVKEASKASQAEQLEMVRQQRASAVEIGLERQQQHSWAGEQFSKRIPGDVADGVDTAKAVGAWSARETGDAWTGLQRRVPQLAVDVAQSTAASAHDGWQASADIFARATVSPWTVWQASGQAGASVAANLFPEAYRVVHGGGLLAAGLVAGTAAAQGVVVQEGGTALMDLSRWNWERGFVQGAQAGTTTARQAWKHDDPTMAVLWGTSGVAKAAWHLLLVQPIAASGLLLGLGGVLAAMGACAVPTAAVVAGLGAVGSMMSLVAGVGVVGLLWMGGGMLGVLLGGVGVVHAAGTWVAGMLFAGMVAAVGTGWLTLVTGGNLALLALVPALGVAGMAGAAMWGVVAAVGRLGWTGVVLAASESWLLTRSLVGNAALVAGGLFNLTVLGVRTAGVQLVEAPLDAALTTAGVWTRSGWRLVENPLQAVAGAVLAGAVLTHVAGGVGTVAVWHLTGATVGTLGHGAAASLHAGLVLLGLGGLGLEFLGRATNIPLHREWADFRAPETARALHTMQERGAPVDAGDIQLVRVNWWGDETGKTRFFITRHPVTGQRWYFERVVDTSTCGVSYRGTNEDPWLRRNAWKGTWETGLVDGVCQAGK